VVGLAIHFNAGIYAVSLLILVYDIYKVLAGEYTRKDKLYAIGYLGLIVGWIVYVYSFLTDQFNMLDVYNYSSRSADWLTKLSSSWSSNGGFIVWMTMVLSVILLYYRFRLLSSDLGEDDPRIYRHVLISNVMLILIVLAIYTSDAFTLMEVTPADGLGLNPILKTFWNYIHPPSAILAYSLGLAVGILAFSNISEGASKFLASLAWLMATAANFLGGIWSYYTLGWGGYWAWDPVETGMLLPWLVLTAYFHATYMGRLFRRALLLLTGFSVAFAAYITRGGAVSPLHGFTGVSWTAFILLVMGIPFLIYALRILRAVDFNNFFSQMGKTYEFSMNITTIAMLGIFLISLVGLATQSLYLVFSGQEIQIGVDYYNYLSFPFAVIFLAFLSGCTLDYIYEETSSFIKNIVLPTSLISAVLAGLVWLRMIVFSPLSNIVTNVLIAVLLPFSVVALISALIYLGKTFMDRVYIKVGLRILHIAVPLMFIAILLSGPYAYNQMYFKNILIRVDEPVYISGVGLKIRNVEFRGPIGWIALPGAESIPNAPLVPEEVESIIYLETTASSKPIPINVRFNFGSYLKQMGAIISEPTVIDLGLDQLYIVVSSASAADLFYYYAKIINDYRAQATDNVTRTIYAHILMFLAGGLGVDPNTFMNQTMTWSPDNAALSKSFIANVKIVPKVGLVWISGSLLMLGEVLTIILESPLVRRSRANE